MESNSILSSLKIAPKYNVEDIIYKEFQRIKGQCYLDHAGAALYSEGQIRQVMKDLSLSLLGNPHSRHTPSDTSSQNIEATRHRILEHFNTTAEEYDLIFTSGATASLRLIAEYFDWNDEQTQQPQNSTASSILEEKTTEIRNDSTKETTDFRDEPQNCTEKTTDIGDDRSTTDFKDESQNCPEKNTDSTIEPRDDLQNKSTEHSKAETTELRDELQNNTTEEIYRGAFVYVQENHTSVLGMRGPACNAGCDVYCLTTEETKDILKDSKYITPGIMTDAKNLSSTSKSTSLTKESVTTSDSSDLKLSEETRTSSQTPQGETKRVNSLFSTSKSTSVTNESMTTSDSSDLKLSKETRTCSQTPQGETKRVNCLFSTSKSISMTNESVTTSDSSDLKLSEETRTCSQTPQGETKRVNCLFAFSAQCNFSGSKAPLDWIEKVQEGALNDLLLTQPINKRTERSKSVNRGCVHPNWYVVLDAAGLVATSPLDLSRWKPDFVPVSFYKIFGYPSGLGCLLVRRRAWGVLRRGYQGGGTVLMADSRRMITVPRPTLHERFEDGTLPYLSIPALRHGLETIQRLTGGIHNIQDHVYHLARYTHHTLRSMRHAQGTPVAHLYMSPDDPWLPHTHGPIINFNLRNPDGSYIGYSQVERVASLYNIHLRTGCLCNPGACQTHLNITHHKLMSQFKAGHVCGDALDLVDGEPTGSVRVSFGYSSTYADADQLLRMILECFVELPVTFDLTWMEGKVDVSWREEVKGVGRGERDGTAEEEEGKIRPIDNNDSGKNKESGKSSYVLDEERKIRSAGKEILLMNVDLRGEEEEEEEREMKPDNNRNGCKSNASRKNSYVMDKEAKITLAGKEVTLLMNSNASHNNNSNVDLTGEEMEINNRKDERTTKPHAVKGNTDSKDKSNINNNTNNPMRNRDLNYEKEINNKKEEKTIKPWSGRGNTNSDDINSINNNSNNPMRSEDLTSEGKETNNKNERKTTKSHPLKANIDLKDKTNTHNNNSEIIATHPQGNRILSPSSQPVTSHPAPVTQSPITRRLTDIILYPVKSCAGVCVGSWGLGEAGLWMDRRWMVVSGAGATLTQKRVPAMALVTPQFDLECEEMVLSYEGVKEELRIPLEAKTQQEDTCRAAVCGGRVCGVRVQGLDCGEAAGKWLSEVLGMVDLRLMMQTSHRSGKLSGKGSGPTGESLSLANESQYLVIHRPSVRSLLQEINSRGLEELTEDELVERFRGNLVMDGGEAYEEDSWDTLTINNTTLQVQGGCRRCQMVCVVPGSGQRTREPMLSLASSRGSSMLFGVHASTSPLSGDERRILSVGATVQVTKK